MVWLHHSPIPIGRSGVISSFKWFLPAFATRRWRGRGSAPFGIILKCLYFFQYTPYYLSLSILRQSFCFAQEYYFNNSVSWNKGRLSLIHFFEDILPCIFAQKSAWIRTSGIVEVFSHVLCSVIPPLPLELYLVERKNMLIIKYEFIFIHKTL
jgi:hypothetical protein